MSKPFYEVALQELLRDPANQVCADCNAKGPRWASYNLGVFLCIRCGGLHRKLGTHITRIKSITLDSWTEDQIENMKKWGNTRANALYVPQGPTSVIVPKSGDGEMEQFIRDKYERKAFVEGSNVYSKYRVQGGQQQMTQQNNMTSFGSDVSVAAPSTARPTQAQSNTFSANDQTKTRLDQALSMLREMGFNDDALNVAALKRANGNFEEAITLLTERRRQSILPQSQVPQPQPSQRRVSVQPLQQQQQRPATQNGVHQDLLDLMGPSTSMQTQVAPQSAPAANFGQQQNATFNDNPFSTFQNVPASAPVPQKQNDANPFGDLNDAFQDKKPSKDAIMSLFNAPPPVTNHAMAMSMGMGIQQQPQQMGLNNSFNNSQVAVMQRTHSAYTYSTQQPTPMALPQFNTSQSQIFQQPGFPPQMQTQTPMYGQNMGANPFMQQACQQPQFGAFPVQQQVHNPFSSVPPFQQTIQPQNSFNTMAQNQNVMQDPFQGLGALNSTPTTQPGQNNQTNFFF